MLRRGVFGVFGWNGGGWIGQGRAVELNGAEQNSIHFAEL